MGLGRARLQDVGSHFADAESSRQALFLLLLLQYRGPCNQRLPLLSWNLITPSPFRHIDELSSLHSSAFTINWHEEHTPTLESRGNYECLGKSNWRSSYSAAVGRTAEKGTKIGVRDGFLSIIVVCVTLDSSVRRDREPSCLTAATLATQAASLTTHPRIPCKKAQVRVFGRRPITPATSCCSSWSRFIVAYILSLLHAPQPCLQIRCSLQSTFQLRTLDQTEDLTWTCRNTWRDCLQCTVGYYLILYALILADV